MKVGALRDAVASARADGRVPFAVIATSGTTVTAAFDPLDAIADLCEADGLWLHVDGCYGGSALFSSRHRHLLRGVERADSFVWNLHKMMGITQQCTALLLRDPAQLEPLFATRANYIFQADKLYREYDTGDRTFQCARRVDALKLWLAWKAAGDAGFADRVEHAVELAAHTERKIRASDGEFAVLVAGGFTNVVFTWVPPALRPLDLSALDASTRQRLHALAPRMKARMQAEGTAMVGYQPVHGLNAFRLLFMNPTVQTPDIDAILVHLARYGAEEWEALAASDSTALP
jgi:glutamate/tyrosine decarboxylase-like PLP-dependent enzyme